MSERSDAELIAAVLDGDAAAFGRLVERYQVAYVRYATRMLSDRALAEDLVQASFVAAYEKLEACENPERFPAWCFQIVRNRCHDHLRSPESRSQGPDPLRSIPSPRADPAVSAERAELRRAIGIALQDLSPLLREAFLLYHAESLTYPEMARRLGASESAVKMRVKRAREALQEELSHWSDHIPT
jgi:RNA polymerase sigma-70 factor (ECF subfamily)